MSHRFSKHRCLAPAVAAFAVAVSGPCWSQAPAAGPGAAGDPNSPAPRPPALPPQYPWTASPAMDAALAPAAQAGPVSVRPPKGYVAVVRASPDGAGTVYGWFGPVRPDTTRADFAVIIAHPPKGQAHQFTVAQVLASLADSHRHGGGWSISPTQSGKIGGLAFERLTWAAGAWGANPAQMGFEYGAQLASGDFVILASSDTASAAPATLPLANAAALTLELSSPSSAHRR